MWKIYDFDNVRRLFLEDEKSFCMREFRKCLFQLLYEDYKRLLQIAVSLRALYTPIA